jgi:hypothetical protein
VDELDVRNKMKSLLRIVTLIFAFSAFSLYAEDEIDLLKNYRGKEVIPESLLEVYTELAGAIISTDWTKVQTMCLPHSVIFTKEKREDKLREYGRDMNEAFMKDSFSPLILSVTKDSDDAYLIRTATSYLSFVHTRSGTWKLYRYGDKPIE